MRKLVMLLFLLILGILASSQEIEKSSTEKLLEELAENSCKCVDSISAINKSKEELSNEINKCIKAQIGAYQLGVTLDKIDELKNEAKTVDGKKQINISLNLNEDTQEYKEYYYEFERYMMDNCNSLKDKMATNSDENEKSFSENIEASTFYELAIEESKKENFEMAVTYYKKAVAIDPEFVNAWDNMGICYRRLEKYDEAIYAYKKSLKIYPKGLMPLQNIAIVYQYKEDYKNAIKAYEKLAKIDDKNPETYYGLGQIYATNLNEYEKGLDYMCKAYNLYLLQKSPYRSDAENLINTFFVELKKKGKEDKFYEILKANNIVTK